MIAGGEVTVLIGTISCGMWRGNQLWSAKSAAVDDWKCSRVDYELPCSRGDIHRCVCSRVDRLYRYCAPICGGALWRIPKEDGSHETLLRRFGVWWVVRRSPFFGRYSSLCRASPGLSPIRWLVAAYRAILGLGDIYLNSIGYTIAPLSPLVRKTFSSLIVAVIFAVQLSLTGDHGLTVLTLWIAQQHVGITPQYQRMPVFFCFHEILYLS